jgi:flagellar biosynthesis protein FlhA
MVLDPQTGLDARITNMRNHVATVFGLILPEIRLTDDPSLPQGCYIVRIQGVEQARDVLRPDLALALLSGDASGFPPGEDVKEPVYGAPARWITDDQKEEMAILGCTIVSSTEVLATHLLEVIKRNFQRLLTMRTLRRLLDEMTNLSDQTRADANQRLLDDLVPEKVPMDLLLSILRLLLEERVSIRNMSLILEAISESRGAHATPESICEHVRHRLGFQLIS